MVVERIREPDRCFAGVDLGGTTVTAGIVRGEIMAEKTTATGPERLPAEILETIAGLVREVAGDARIGGIGVGVPTPVRGDGDRLVPCDNLPTMGEFPLRTRLEERLQLPVLLENDANVMALGEQRAGALRGCNHCVCLTLGTGLGCGIIIDGAIYRGATLFAGEIWNIPSSRGKNLEDTVAAQALRAIAAEWCGASIEPSDLYEAYCRGDENAARAFDLYGEIVGEVAIMILSVLDPERVAIGGGISGAWPAFGPAMRRTVAARLGKEAAGRIVPASLSGRAAVIGAASLIEQRLRSP